MLVYKGIKSDFMHDIESSTLAATIEKNILEKYGKHTVANEYKSWENSLIHMYIVLNDTNIPLDAGIAIEYNVPLTSKRVDFMISGYDENNLGNVIIVELKQWEHVETVESSTLVKTFINGGIREVVHPSYQAWSYAQLISDYNSVVQSDNISLKPVAYLHNYERRNNNDPIEASQYKEIIDVAPLYAKTEGKSLTELIKGSIRKGDNMQLLYDIDDGKIKPSKNLQNMVVSMLNGNKEFIMVDEQQVAFENLLKIALKCQKDQKKRTVIVQGGPGTGKSVIAIQLLSKLIQNNQFVQYVSKNLAPRSVYLKKLKQSKSISCVDNLFKGSASYTGLASNQIHTLIVDEAHRLAKRSRYTKDTGNNNQIQEIIHAAKCSIFFIDESQRVTMEDIGSVKEIEDCAKRELSELYYYELSSQFRCNGSDGYLAFIDDLLEIRETANYSIDDINYDIQVFDDPNELRKSIVEKNKNGTSRILAGYCWDWPTEGRNNTDYHDIKIGNFEISWNLRSGEDYAINENSINECGCIHTTQGLEFDYVGVIIGNDLIYDGKQILTDFNARAKTDTSLNGIKTLCKSNPILAYKRADELIKNTYRTLMTRGTKGCYIYCTNKQLSEYIKRRISLNRDKH